MANCLHSLRTLLIAALLMGKGELRAQQTLQGKITGEKGEPLPYAAVLVKNSGRGYLSNEEGLFIVNAGPLDTLLIRHIGYTPLIMAASALKVSGTVRMQTDVRQIGEVTVHPGDEYLYREVLACREALATQPSFKSKAYYLLEGEANGTPTELMECYYNSVYSARKVDQLVFKNGRVALAPADNTYFISADFSKAFAMNDLTLSHQRLPISPLHLGSTQLRKHYDLSLGGYSGPNGEVMHILCKPRRDVQKYYSGELWINTSTHLPMKIVLDIPRTRRHPLLSLHRNRGEIDNAGIHFEKVFVNHQGKHLVKNTLLRYQYTFTPLGKDSAGRRRPLRARSKALIHFYDHDELFIPPYFSYDPRHDDYKNIAGMSYNESFWNYNNSFFQSRSLQEKIKHFRRHGFLLNYRSGVLLEDGSWSGAMYEANYLPWKEKRRLFIRKGNVMADTSRPAEFQAREGRALFDLRAQLYLDVNMVDGSPRWFSAAVFDSHQSYYDLDPDPRATCFINIFFDLYEMERRELENDLAACSPCSVQAIDSLYHKHKKKVDAAASLFLLRANRGNDLEEMAHWNTDVSTALGIDNMKLQGLVPQVKKQ